MQQTKQKSYFVDLIFILLDRITFLNFLGRAYIMTSFIVTSYINGWYLFWYQWKEDVHTYILVENLGLYDLQY